MKAAPYSNYPLNLGMALLPDGNCQVLLNCYASQLAAVTYLTGKLWTPATAKALARGKASHQPATCTRYKPRERRVDGQHPGRWALEDGCSHSRNDFEHTSYLGFLSDSRWFLEHRHSKF